MASFNTQPVSNIEWIHRDELHANDYNPNHVAPPELRLLKISILEDGWTQPIVIREDNEIVDGFHRWTVSGDKAVFELTDGYVPVVRLTGKSREHQMMSTIRHNRARGSHYVVKMADIVSEMVENGVDETLARNLLQMDQEEIERLLDHGNMRKRGSRAEFNNGWKPV